MILESSTLLEETLAYGAVSWTNISITQQDFFSSQIIFDYIVDHGWHDLPFKVVLIKQTHSKCLFYSAL